MRDDKNANNKNEPIDVECESSPTSPERVKRNRSFTGVWLGVIILVFVILYFIWW